jgi:uncharacterized membrane protein YdjX (TVP38/TMEM64 family)
MYTGEAFGLTGSSA